jgi:predicted transcriptional regulator of viral defense system
MTNDQNLQAFIDSGNDIFTVKDLVSANIHHISLPAFVASGKLERVAYGVYATPEAFEDKMCILQKRNPSIVYSHETALYLHDLTDRDPISYTITVPSGYNTKRFSSQGLCVHLIKRDLHRVGLTQKETIFGHSVNVYSIERTICDIIRDRNNMDVDIITQAMKRYAKRTDKDLNILMEYAEKFRVTQLLRNYMEVLL